jgi:hypothetical protein
MNRREVKQHAANVASKQARKHAATLRRKAKMQRRAWRQRDRVPRGRVVWTPNRDVWRVTCPEDTPAVKWGNGGDGAVWYYPI